MSEAQVKRRKKLAATRAKIAKPIIKKLRKGLFSESELAAMREAILSGDCFLCKTSGFKSTCIHIFRSHGITRKELSDYIGFTYTESICDRSLAKRFSEMRRGASPRDADNYKEPNHKERAYSKKAKQIRKESLNFFLAGFKNNPEKARNAGRVGGKKNKGQRRSPIIHGTRSEYRKGCRCDLCGEANRSFWRDFRKKRSSKS